MAPTLGTNTCHQHRAPTPGTNLASLGLILKVYPNPLSLLPLVFFLCGQPIVVAHIHVWAVPETTPGAVASSTLLQVATVAAVLSFTAPHISHPGSVPGLHSHTYTAKIHYLVISTFALYPCLSKWIYPHLFLMHWTWCYLATVRQDFLWGCFDFPHFRHPSLGQFTFRQIRFTKGSEPILIGIPMKPLGTWKGLVCHYSDNPLVLQLNEQHYPIEWTQKNYPFLTVREFLTEMKGTCITSY